MQLVGITLLQVLFFHPLPVLTTTTDTNNMDRDHPAGVRRDDEGRIDITLSESAGDEDASLECDVSDPERGMPCSDLPSGDCCQVEHNELFDSARNNKAPRWTSFSVYSGDDRNPCQQIITSTSSADTDCLAGGPAGSSITGAAVEGSTGDGDGDGKNTTTDENGEKNDKKKKRAVRANLYSYRVGGTIYHIPIKSSLGEVYRNLPRAQQLDFMIKNGLAKPYSDTGRLCLRRAQ